MRKYILISALSLFAQSALAGTINLSGGESITLSANTETTVTCGGGTNVGPGQSVQSTVDLNCVVRLYNSLSSTPTPDGAIELANNCRTVPVSQPNCSQVGGAFNQTCYNQLYNIVSVTPTQDQSMRMQTACRDYTLLCH